MDFNFKKVKNPSEKKDEKKKDLKTTVGVIAGLAVLLGISAYFVFHDSGSTTYRETRTGTSALSQALAEDAESKEETTHSIPSEVRMVDATSETDSVESEDTTENAYMTVTIPGYSNDDINKAEQEEAAMEAEAESTGTTVTQVQNTARTRTDTTNPSVVKHYYTTPSGTTSTKPSNTSDTVYVVEYDKNKTLTETDVQNIILDYLKSDSTYIESTKQKTSSTSKQNTSKEDDAGIIIENPDTASSADIVNGGMVVETADTEMNVGTVSTGMNVQTSEIHGSGGVSVNEGFKLTEDMIKPYIQWYMTDNDGSITLSTLGVPTSEIQSIIWEVRLIAGNGDVSDTDNPLKKNVHLEEASAIEVTAIVTYYSGLVKNTDPVIVNHKNYVTA